MQAIKGAKKAKAKAKASGQKKKKVNVPNSTLSADLDSISGKLNTLLKDQTKGLGAQAGKALGSMFGLGGLGEMAGDTISKILGFGDYKVNVNSLISPGSELALSHSDVPQFVTNAKGGHYTRVAKREFVGMLTSSSVASAFSVQSYRINPGNPALFPWLSSTLALGHSKFRILGLTVTLRSVASEYASGGTLGVMGCAIDYQNLDPVYSSKIAAEQSEGAMSCKVSEDLVFGIECDPAVLAQPNLYVRNGGVPTGGTLNQYDHGYLQVFTQGVPTASLQVAEIWVTYDIEFEAQELLGGPVGGGVTSVVVQTATGIAAATPLGSGVTWNQSGDLFLTSTINTIVIPPWFTGLCLFSYTVSGGSGAWNLPTFTYGANITPQTVGIIGSSPLAYVGSSGTSIGMSFQTILSVSNVTPGTAANTITLGVGGTFTAATSLTIVIVQVNAPIVVGSSAGLPLGLIGSQPAAVW